MRNAITTALLFGCLGFTPAHAQQDEHRQLGAHVHGAGKLDIAIEKRTVEIELEVPGSDIVGFEHAASTPEQKQAVAQARATLSKPLGLIRIPVEAGCKVTSSEVKVVAGDHDHDHDHDHAHDHQNASKDKHAEGHAEFHAEYKLTCSRPERITSIELDYFKSFPRSEKLDVSIVGDKVQVKAVATKDKPTISLK